MIGVLVRDHIDRELAEAKRRLAELEAEARKVIRVLTAEQALRAQRVVREAGRRNAD